MVFKVHYFYLVFSVWTHLHYLYYKMTVHKYTNCDALFLYLLTMLCIIFLPLNVYFIYIWCKIITFLNSIYFLKYYLLISLLLFFIYDLSGHIFKFLCLFINIFIYCFIYKCIFILYLWIYIFPYLFISFTFDTK